MVPQLVSKVKVRANRLGSFSAGATDGGVCPTALVALHFIAGTFADLTDLPFVSAKADGERIKEVAITATTKTLHIYSPGHSANGKSKSCENP